MKVTKDSVAPAIKTLISSGNADNEPQDLYIPNMVTEQLWDTYKHKFKKHVVEAIERRKASNLIYQYDEPTKNAELYYLIDVFKKLDLNPVIKETKLSNISSAFSIRAFEMLTGTCEPARKMSQVRFFGCAVEDSNDIPVAIDKLSAIIEEYVNNDFVMGNLNPLMYVPFLEGGAVVSYLIFTEEGVEYLEQDKPAVHIYEGERPRSLEEI
jgi:hypothetical protein